MKDHAYVNGLGETLYVINDQRAMNACSAAVYLIKDIGFTLFDAVQYLRQLRESMVKAA